MNRRNSLKLLSTLPLVAAFPAVAAEKSAKPAAKAAPAKGPKNLIDEKDTLASAMQYVHDASKAKMRTNKKANCTNCAKYNVCMEGDTTCKPLKPAALKKSEVAPCQIFKGKVVKGKGWCLSWSAKA